MLTEKTGDLFSTDAPAIGHGVNVDGIMGAGVAKIVRENYPSVFEYYFKECAQKNLLPGEMNGWLTTHPNSDKMVIIFNLASQDRPGANATYEWTVQSVNSALYYCRQLGYTKLALPRIGCGIGGLSWEVLKPMLGVLAIAYPEIELEIWSL